MFNLIPYANDDRSHIHSAIHIHHADEQAKINQTTWTRNRDNQQSAVGQFHVDSIEADGTLHAGCHVIAYDELAMVATQLGLNAQVQS